MHIAPAVHDLRATILGLHAERKTVPEISGRLNIPAAEVQAYIDEHTSWLTRDALNHRFRAKRKHAISAGIPFNITLEDVIWLWEAQQGRCFYTDEPLVFADRFSTPPNSFSFDKIQPLRGYVRGNVVLCGVRANTLKGDMTLPEMKRYNQRWYRRIVAFQQEFFGDAPPKPELVAQQLQLSFL